jgi:chorismate mutase/prephenate dehydratase
MTSDGADPQAEIDALRRRIDAVDRDIVRLLAQRLQAASDIGRIKQEGDVALVDEARELEVQQRWRAHAAAEGVPGVVADSVLREIVTHSRRVQESEPHGLRAAAGPRVAFQGAAGAYSERAVRELAARDGKPGVQPIGFATFEQALDALEAGDVDHALLPVDNSICGRIDAVWDALAARPVFAVDEITSRVDHCLVGLPDAELAQLTRIRSHPVALAQCGRALASLPGATPEPWGDTADAARSVASAQDPSLAALCHEDAGRLHGLVVLRRDMADAADNRTRFLLLARLASEVQPGVDVVTAAMVDAADGLIESVLRELVGSGMSLLRLSTRAAAGDPTGLRVELEFAGRADEGANARVLASLRASGCRVRVLGAWAARGNVNQPER